MLNITDIQNLNNIGMQKLSGDARERQVATRMFDRRLNLSQRKKLFSGLRGKSRQLQSLASSLRPTNSHHLGAQIVDIDAIHGTENRSTEFDSEFLPTDAFLQDRWVNVATALLRGVALPPVELLCVNGEYFVRDGHHRISVMKALGYRQIDAVVTAYED